MAGIGFNVATRVVSWYLCRMCFSAMVEQEAKELGGRFQARVQIDMYDDLFKRRSNGEKILINKAMELQFIRHAKTPAEKQIRSNILEWRKTQIESLETELFNQKRRLGDAERTLGLKVTKKAENEKRVSSKKISKIQRDLMSLNSDELLSETEERIFPLHYMSVVCLDENGEKVVRPMRYLMRPHDKNPDFDLKFGGCYNARFDNLENVAWWKDSLLKRHGLIVVKKFYENVPAEKYAKNFKLPDSESERENIVICFSPDDTEYMYIPVLWDVWKLKGQPDLFSAALITDDPLPEVAAAGHDRTPIFLKESAVDEWLNAVGSVAKAKSALMVRQIPHYSHRITGVA